MPTRLSVRVVVNGGRRMNMIRPGLGVAGLPIEGTWDGLSRPPTTARTVCRSCNGAGGRRKETRYFERCSRCGGAGGKKSGKVRVPCSGCGGAGGKNKTSITIENCKTCGGSGYK
jgi:hypothetical protein